jgi:hypothetical protein
MVADGLKGHLVRSAPDDGIMVRNAAIADDAGGVAAPNRADQVLTMYARTLTDAGFDVARSAPGLAVRGRSADSRADRGRPADDAVHDSRTLADRAAAAANTQFGCSETCSSRH